MNPATVEKVRAIAAEVVALCDELKATSQKSKRWDHNTGTYVAFDRWKAKQLDSGKQTAALRRRSMDLTRALAEMRKP